MKLKDVKVGERYVARVSGNLVEVLVTNIEERPGWGTSGRTRTIITATNQVTRRTVTFRSAQRLRPRPALVGCEYCRTPANRNGAVFTCPKCGARWRRRLPPPVPFDETQIGGAFDGINVISDADPGL